MNKIILPDLNLQDDNKSRIGILQVLRDGEVTTSSEPVFCDGRFGPPVFVAASSRRYQMNGAIALELVAASGPNQGESVSVASVNIPGQVFDGEIAIRNWGDGEGIEDLLASADLIEGEPLRTVHFGHHHIPVYRVGHALERLVNGETQLRRQSRPGH